MSKEWYIYQRFVDEESGELSWSKLYTGPSLESADAELRRLWEASGRLGVGDPNRPDWVVLDRIPRARQASPELLAAARRSHVAAMSAEERWEAR